MKTRRPEDSTALQADEVESERANDRREFQRNLAVTLAAHVILLLVFAIIAKLQPKPVQEEIMWLDGGLLGGGDAGEIQQAALSEPIPEPEPEPEPMPEPPPPEPEPPKPEPLPKPDELALPQATPEPATPKPATPKPATPEPATPKPATPKPTTPKPATPKPTPRKSTPKEKPKASPKKTTPKKSTPKAESSRSDSDTKEKSGSADKEKPSDRKEGSGDSTSAKKGNSTGSSVGEGKGKGTAGNGPGAGKPSDFGWYFAGLRDKFYAVWVPPSVPDGSSLVVRLKIKVKRDGTVLGYELVKSSGNSMMDGSVLDAARQITQIDPLPEGLGKGEELDIPVDFKPE